MEHQKVFYCGAFIDAPAELEVVNPHTGETQKVGQADEQIVTDCTEKSHQEKDKIGQTPTHLRKKVLNQIADGLEGNIDAFVDTIIFESAKPYKYALGEVKRGVQTFRIAAEEAGRNAGEFMPLDWTEAGENKDGIIKKIPIGVVAGISPFNFPLNLAAHKIAPAIAAGCPIILKPASKTPLTMLKLAEIVAQTDWPDVGFSVLPCSRDAGNLLVTSKKINLLSFTGSPEVGWTMKANAGKKKVVLELGGNAAGIVHKDADIDHAIDRLLVGGFAYSGQVCIHTQRIYVHESVYDTFKAKYAEAIRALQAGDPKEKDTDFSSIISDKHVQRINQWVAEAVEAGAKNLTESKTEGSIIYPVLLENVDQKSKVYAEEVFGPVVCIAPYSTEEEAIDAVNNSRYGLQACVFSDSQSFIHRCFDGICVGGLVVNDATTFRVDHMPYGGVKESGLGREGVQYAIEDMTEQRIMVTS